MVVVSSDDAWPLGCGEQAIERRNLEILGLLVDAGADINSPDNKGSVSHVYEAVAQPSVAMSTPHHANTHNHTHTRALPVQTPAMRLLEMWRKEDFTPAAWKLLEDSGTW